MCVVATKLIRSSATESVFARGPTIGAGITFVLVRVTVRASSGLSAGLGHRAPVEISSGVRNFEDVI